MITKVIQIDGSEHEILANGDVCKLVTYYGKSTDVKPIEGVNNAERFYEMDTRAVFMFDEDSKTWLAQ